MKLLCLVALLATTVFADPFVRELVHFQAASGGFHELGHEETDLESTAHALFLAALYGQGAQVNIDDAAQYVQGLASQDGSYSIASGKPADLEATRFALMSFVNAKKDIPEQAATSKFILSLLHSSVAAFEVKSTALAIESLSILGDLPNSVKDLLGSVKEQLSSKIVDNSHFVFDAASTTPVSDNYYGIYLAQRAGLELPEKSKWAKYIQDLQNLDDATPGFGGFFSSEKKTEVTAEATAHAVMALKIIGNGLGNEQALSKFTQMRKANLRETALTHLAFAHSSLFKASIRSQILAMGAGGQIVESQMVQGSKVAFLAFVSVFDGKAPHGGFDISVSDGEGWSTSLDFHAANNRYIAAEEYEADELGEVNFSFVLKATAYPVGDVVLRSEESKRVGFQINLEEKAEFGGRTLEEGETFSPGTEVSFELTFSTQDKSEFFSGDFALDFRVLDASTVVQHTSTIDGNDNDKAITLSYTVSGADFPAGEIVFWFEVRDSDGGVHTRHGVRHTLEQQMVAAGIDFDGKGASPTYKLGDTLKVSMQPAVLKDLHTISPFLAANAAERTFVMDLVSAQGTTYSTVSGTPVSGGDSASYEFSTELPLALDPIGQTTAVFRFESAGGTSVKLYAFDLQASELAEDSAGSQFTVDAVLQLDEVEQQPSKKDFTFGSSIPLKFKVRDTVSNKHIGVSKMGSVNVVLRSGEGDSAFESLRSAAAFSDGFFSHELQIDANSARGAGDVSILALGVDGEEIPVYAAGTKNAVRYPVVVGGDISVQKNLYTTSSVEMTKTSFVSAFSLTCQSKTLLGAKLLGSLLVKNGSDYSVVHNHGVVMSNLQVATSPSGEYSFSASMDHGVANSGQYKMRFVRQVDHLQAQATGGSAEVLFEVDFSHKKVEKSGLWMQMEILTAIVLGALFVGVSSHVRQFDPRKHA